MARYDEAAKYYADDAVFEGLERQSAQLLKMLMESGADWVYFPKPAKSLFLLDTPGQDEATRR